MFKFKCNGSVIPPVFSIALVCIVSTGCASIVKGTTQTIPVSSVPSNADVLVDGNLVGTTPTDVELKRKRDHLVTIEKKNYSSKSVPVVKNVGGAVWGNILLGGLIGWGVDASTGAQYNLEPKTIYVKLDRLDGDEAAASSNGSFAAIQKLNNLDTMLENKQISDEEYSKGRQKVIEEHFPEMIPKEEMDEGAMTDTDMSAEEDSPGSKE